MEDGMKADVFEISNFFDGSQVGSVTVTQAQHRPARAEHLLPNMGKGMGRSIRVYRNRFV
jgi:hypothetical protein